MISPTDVFGILGSRIIPINPTWDGLTESLIFQVRLPRILLSLLVGAGLAVTGASFQGVFRNPLVGPDLLGVSAGAGFGACLGILLSADTLVTYILSLGFGFLAIVGAYLISKLKMGISLLMLVLAGVIVGTLFQALIGLIKYIADPTDKLPTIVYWLMGSMARANYSDLLWGAPLIIIGISLLFLLRWRINVLSLGDEEAQSIGINAKKLRWVVISAATLITATSVTLCGIIGWVGLVVPHIGRMIVGPNHRALIPTCICLGASFLLVIDDLARAATAAEIPISLLSAVVGAPIFAYLLKRTGGKWTQ